MDPMPVTRSRFRLVTYGDMALAVGGIEGHGGGTVTNGFPTTYWNKVHMWRENTGWQEKAAYAFPVIIIGRLRIFHLEDKSISVFRSPLTVSLPTRGMTECTVSEGLNGTTTTSATPAAAPPTGAAAAPATAAAPPVAPPMIPTATASAPTAAAVRATAAGAATTTARVTGTTGQLGTGPRSIITR